MSDYVKSYYAGGFRVMRGGVPCRVAIKMKGDVAIRSKDWKATRLAIAEAEVADLKEQIAQAA